MSSTTLKQAMPIVATALGRRFGVQVQIGGQQAATDGATIWLPDLPADSRLRPVAWGLLAHEASHVRHTDMTAYRAAAQHSPLRRHLLNLLEDIRIELAIRRDYPGTEATLARVIDWMLAEGRLAPPQPSDHPARILTDAVLLILRQRVLGQTALTEAAQQAERVLRQTFPAPLVHRLFGLLTEVRGLGSTAAAADLAARIQQWLDDEARQPPLSASPPSDPDRSTPQDQPGPAPNETPRTPTNGSQDAPGAAPAEDCDSDPPREDGQEANEDGIGDPSRVGAPDRTGETGDGAPPGGDAVAEPSANPPGRPSGAIAGAPTGDAPIRRALAAGAEDLADDLFTSARQALASASGAGLAGPLRLPVGEDPPCDPQWGEALRRQVEGTSRALSARLEGLVQACRIDRPHAVARGRRLLPTRLYRAGVGEARLFARRRERPAPNTAFHLLVDLSDSMQRQTGSGRRAFRVALEAALAVALALERIPGVSLAVSAFPGLDGEAARITRLVQHGQSVRRRAGAFQQGPRGDTPLAQALWYAAADLALRPEPRRVILVMTDGVPNDWAAAVEIRDLCERQGIEPMGLGIACDVSALFRVGTRVDEAGDLKQALFGLAERRLV